jgi:hypothetical protein
LGREALPGQRPRDSASAPLLGLPIQGFAECGLKNWYRPAPQSVTASRPGDFIDPKGFAVIASGRSMEPAGIFEGFLCFCAPSIPEAAGDAVYVARADGSISLKRFRRRVAQMVVLEGWYFEDDSPGLSYTEQVRADLIIELAPVIYIKRKL